MYIQVHWNPAERLLLEHLIDNLAENTLGRRNLELKKNCTIDVFDSDGDAFLRDNAGFFVADRLQLHQITVDAQQMLRLIQPTKSEFVSSSWELILIHLINTFRRSHRRDHRAERTRRTHRLRWSVELP
jgi:hypothetical protein